MSHNLRKIFWLGIFCSVFTCALPVPGQVKTGGYKSASVSDAGVKAAADFAVRQKAAAIEQELQLEGIVKAETEVVSGTNYRLCLQLYIPAKEEETDGITLYIKTVIYKTPGDEFSISSWAEEDCAEL